MSRNWLRRLYAPEFLVKGSMMLGEIPPAGRAYKTALETAWASITESFLIALISMADTVMVGVVGHEAIAAVGLVTQPRFIVLTPVMALNMAVTSITARRRGENNQDGANRCLQQALVLSLALSCGMAAVAFLLRTPLLLFAGAQPDTLPMARDYLAVLLAGIPASAISMTISSAQRGIGGTKVAMRINMTANVVNLVLNYLLIGGRLGFPALGVRGAAIATVVGWGCGFVLAVLSVAHKDRFLFIFTRQGWRFEAGTLRAIYQVASGSFVEQVCMRAGFLAYAKVVAGLGTVMFATHNICINILSLSFSFGEGLGIASSSLVGRNLGAKRPDLSLVYGKICQRMSFVTSTIMFFLFIFGGRFLISLFTDEAQIMDIGGRVMWIMGLVVVGQASQMIFMGSLRGAGDTRYTAVISLISVLLIRPALAYTLAYPLGLGLIGAWSAFAVDQYLRLFLTARRFSSGEWMSIKL